MDRGMVRHGQMERARRRAYAVAVTADHGGANCTNRSGAEQSEPCNDGPCPVDCMGHWSAWGGCSRCAPLALGTVFR